MAKSDSVAVAESETIASGCSSSVRRAVVGLDGDGERRRRGRLDRGRRGGLRRRGVVVAAARGEDEGEQDSQEGCEGTVEHVSSFREGNGSRRASGLLTRGSLLRRLPGPRASGISAEERLPSQRRDRAGLAPASLGRSPSCRAGAYTLGLRWTAVAAARLNLWLPVVLWAALIFTFSSIPSLGTGLGTWDLVLRKLAHAAEFAVLGALLYRALGASRSRSCSARPTRSPTSCTRSSSPGATARRSTG